MSDLDDDSRETLAYWIRQWRHAVALQLTRIASPDSDDDWEVDVDFLPVAMYLLDRACDRAGRPIPEPRQLVDRVRHEIEHPEDRDASHVFIEGHGFLTLWTWGRGHRGKGPETGAVVEVIDEAKAAMAHADTVLAELPPPPTDDPFVDLDAETIETVAGEAAHAITQAWQQEADQT